MEPNWKPLEKRLGQRRCAGFMFMGRINGVNIYEHGIARLELNLDDNGRCCIWQNKTFKGASFEEELAKIEVVLTQMEETL